MVSPNEFLSICGPLHETGSPGVEGRFMDGVRPLSLGQPIERVVLLEGMNQCACRHVRMLMPSNGDGVYLPTGLLDLEILGLDCQSLKFSSRLLDRDGGVRRVECQATDGDRIMAKAVVLVGLVNDGNAAI